jgi:hypothetical protein
MQGIHGLLLDSLESVQMVTASGELVVSLMNLINHVQTALIFYPAPLDRI